MPVYNSLDYDKLVADGDYTGLANYIESMLPNVTDETQKQALINNINSLRNYGGIANKILQDDFEDESEDKKLFLFNANRVAGFGGEIGDNDYFKKYKNYKSNIGNVSHWFKPNETAIAIGYQFDNENAYNSFIDKSGIVVDKSLNVTKTYNEGKPVLRVGKTAFQDEQFFENLTKTLSSMQVNNLYSIGANTWGYNPTIAAFNTIGYNEYGEKISSVNGLDSNQQRALALINSGSDVFNKHYNARYEKIIPRTLNVMGYMCGAQRDLLQKVSNKEIGESEFNLYYKQLTDFYDNKLKSFSFTGYNEVYMTEPNSTSQTLDIMPEDAKGEWTNYLRTAIAEKRVTYTAGFAGDRVGTVITIDRGTKSGELSKADYAAGVQFFVPGLFDKDARAVINADDNARLAVEIAEHQSFGHNYDLIDKGRLTNFDGDGSAIYEDDNSRIPLSPDQVHNIIKRNILIEGGIQAAKSMLRVNRNNVPINTEEIIRLVDIYSKNVFADLNDIKTSEELTQALEDHLAAAEVDNIFMIILNKLGLDRLGNPIN